MNEKQIKKIRSGVKKYLTITQVYWNTDVAKNPEFQKMFNGFYKIQRRNQNWYAQYYQMLEELKRENKCFGDLLRDFYNKCVKVEKSFISKMYAIRNPEYPIIDKWISKNLGIKWPYSYDKKRLDKTILTYDILINRYKDLLATEKGTGYIKQFDEICPHCNITDIKKIDFILWQMR